jgi:hypothetical protein
MFCTAPPLEGPWGLGDPLRIGLASVHPSGQIWSTDCYGNLFGCAECPNHHCLGRSGIAVQENVPAFPAAILEQFQILVS